MQDLLSIFWGRHIQKQDDRGLSVCTTWKLQGSSNFSWNLRIFVKYLNVPISNTYARWKSMETSACSCDYTAQLKWTPIHCDSWTQSLSHSDLAAQARIKEKKRTDFSQRYFQVCASFKLFFFSLLWHEFLLGIPLIVTQRGAILSEPAIQVRRKGKGKQIWSLEKLENRLVDMRDLYQEWKDCEEDNPVSKKVFL